MVVGTPISINRNTPPNQMPADQGGEGSNLPPTPSGGSGNSGSISHGSSNGGSSNGSPNLNNNFKPSPTSTIIGSPLTPAPTLPPPPVSLEQIQKHQAQADALAEANQKQSDISNRSLALTGDQDALNALISSSNLATDKSLQSTVINSITKIYGSDVAKKFASQAGIILDANTGQVMSDSDFQNVKNYISSLEGNAPPPVSLTSLTTIKPTSIPPLASIESGGIIDTSKASLSDAETIGLAEFQSIHGKSAVPSVFPIVPTPLTTHVEDSGQGLVNSILEQQNEINNENQIQKNTFANLTAMAFPQKSLTAGEPFNAGTLQPTFSASSRNISYYTPEELQAMQSDALHNTIEFVGSPDDSALGMSKGTINPNNSLVQQLGLLPPVGVAGKTNFPKITSLPTLLTNPSSIQVGSATSLKPSDNSESLSGNRIILPPLATLQVMYPFVDASAYADLQKITSDVNNSPITSFSLLDANGKTIGTLNKSPNFVNDLLNVQANLRAQGMYAVGLKGSMQTASTVLVNPQLSDSQIQQIQKTVSDAKAKGISTLTVTGTSHGFPIKMNVPVDDKAESTLQLILLSSPNVQFNISGSSKSSSSQSSTNITGYMMPSMLLAVNPWTRSANTILASMKSPSGSGIPPILSVTIPPAGKQKNDESLPSNPIIAFGTGFLAPFENIPKDIVSTAQWAFAGFPANFQPSKDLQSQKTVSSELINVGISRAKSALNMPQEQPETLDQAESEFGQNPAYYLGTIAGDVALFATPTLIGKAFDITKEALTASKIQKLVNTYMPDIQKSMTVSDNIASHQQTISELENNIVDINNQIMQKAQPSLAEQILNTSDKTQQDLEDEIAPLVQKRTQIQNQVQNLKNLISSLKQKQYTTATPEQIAENIKTVKSNTKSANDLASKGISFVTDESGVTTKTFPNLANKFGGIKTQVDNLVKKIPIVKNLVNVEGESQNIPIVSDFEKISNNVYQIHFAPTTETSPSPFIGAFITLGKEQDAFYPIFKSIPNDLKITRNEEVEKQAMDFIGQQLNLQKADVLSDATTKGYLNNLDDVRDAFYQKFNSETIPEYYDVGTPNADITKSALDNNLIDRAQPIGSTEDEVYIKRLMSAWLPPSSRIAFAKEIPVNKLSELTKMDKYGLSKMITGENGNGWMDKIKRGDLELMKSNMGQLIHDSSLVTPTKYKEFSMGTGLQEGEVQTGFNFMASRFNPLGLDKESLALFDKKFKPIELPNMLSEDLNPSNVARANRYTEMQQDAKDAKTLQQMMEKPNEIPTTKEENDALLREFAKQFVNPDALAELSKSEDTLGNIRTTLLPSTLMSFDAFGTVKADYSSSFMNPSGVGGKGKYRTTLKIGEKSDYLGSIQSETEKLMNEIKSRHKNKNQNDESFVFNFGQQEASDNENPSKQSSKGNIGIVVPDLWNLLDLDINQKFNESKLPNWIFAGMTKQNNKQKLKTGQITKTGLTTSSQTSQDTSQSQSLDTAQKYNQQYQQVLQTFTLDDLLQTPPPTKKKITPQIPIPWGDFIRPDNGDAQYDSGGRSLLELWGVGDKPLQYLPFEVVAGKQNIKNVAKKYGINWLS